VRLRTLLYYHMSIHEDTKCISCESSSYSKEFFAVQQTFYLIMPCMILETDAVEGNMRSQIVSTVTQQKLCWRIMSLENVMSADNPMFQMAQ
jgi:hypothetical protein